MTAAAQLALLFAKHVLKFGRCLHQWCGEKWKDSRWQIGSMKRDMGWPVQYYILSFPGCSGCYEEDALEISAVAPLSGSNPAACPTKWQQHAQLSPDSITEKAVVNNWALLQLPCISPSENLCNFKRNTTSRKEKQLLMFISLAYWKTTQHASSREHNMLDGSSQLQLVGRSFLKPCSSTLSSLMLSLSAPISDLILVNQSLQSSHALGQLSCCRLVPSVPFHTAVLTLSQCHSHHLDFVFIVLLQPHCAYLSKTMDRSKGQWPICVLWDLSLKLSFGFIKALQLEEQLNVLSQGAATQLKVLLWAQMLPFNPSAWAQCIQSHKWNYLENLQPVSSRG